MSLPLAFFRAAIMVAEREEDPRGREGRGQSHRRQIRCRHAFPTADPSLPMETLSPSCCTAAATVGFPGRGARTGERERERESPQREKHDYTRTEGGGRTRRRRGRLVAAPLVARNGATVAGKHARASKLTGNTTLPLF
ncbi:uncharacterized protein LOC107624066 isoform X2 [Arachis ipaensis]|uniref:uncharacterized protein LOC107624066 isoform X1 n=1 Tax=Arachis ipaensis TaxID=130454 RepID=UPI0007AFA3CB|nr:uncharacterized protein LOC107624066 isoform X1 [Arachis ipaensis]XP_020968994.1 uncharacterized protein LOC107624066 isoform X2 [Arachis ipaensis]